MEMEFSKHLKRVQDLPLIKRKIIFWAVIIVFGLIMFSLYIIDIHHKIKTFSIKQSLQELKLPEIKKEVEKFDLEGKAKEIKENIK